MIWLEVKYSPEVDDSAEALRYRLQATVLSAGGIDRNVFVYRTVDERFSHAALPYDLNTFPVGRAAALAAGTEFYREAATTLVFQSTSDTETALRFYKSRLKLLVLEWNRVQTAPLGNETIEVYTSE